MISNVVLWKFRPDITAEQRNAFAAAAKSMVDKLAQVEQANVVDDLGLRAENPNSYDLALISQFAARADFASYLAASEHREFVAKYVRAWTEATAMVQFETLPLA